MLDKLVFSIELHAGSDPAWLEHDVKLKQRAYDYADKILRDLEAAGMLPPEVEIRSYEWDDMGTSAIREYKWEPEDEEK